jgi:hypothetical protein
MCCLKSNHQMSAHCFCSLSTVGPPPTHRPPHPPPPTPTCCPLRRRAGGCQGPPELGSVHCRTELPDNQETLRADGSSMHRELGCTALPWATMYVTLDSTLLHWQSRSDEAAALINPDSCHLVVVARQHVWGVSLHHTRAGGIHSICISRDNAFMRCLQSHRSERMAEPKLNRLKKRKKVP